MNKPKLPKRELDICNRLRFAREEILKITQNACAEQLRLDRSTLANYETCRTPLRYETALRFCRQLIISEEWLATGRFELLQAAAKEKGLDIQSPQGAWGDFEQLFCSRHCMDLLSDHASRHIAHGALFSHAFDTVLKSRYAQLVSASIYLPRIALTEADDPALAVNFLHTIHERHFALLRNQAREHHKKESDGWRMYTRRLFECADIVWRKLMGDQLSSEFLRSYDWLRAVASDPNADIGSIDISAEYQTLDKPRTAKQMLTNSAALMVGKPIVDKLPSSDMVPSMSSEIPTWKQVVAALKRLTKSAGAKAQLAKDLKTSRQNVNKWLSGAGAPSADLTLEVFRWVRKHGG